ncbi:MAG: hypothetical protein ABGW85_00125 [Sulfurimonas sp.]
MLIYNYQKEFLGIEEKDLKTLGFSTLAELKTEVNDFADLFVKTPGYVHNFKHVHWIDFIAYADEGEEAKVLINVNAKTFTAKLTLSKAYLADNPSAPAFMIHLHGLRSLSNDETEKLSAGILERELPEVTHKEATNIIPPVSPIIEELPDSSSTLISEQETPPITSLSNDYDQEMEPTPQIQEEDISNLSIDIDESIFQDDDMFENTPMEQEVISTQTETKTVPPASSSTTKAAQKLANSGFVYDPNIASRELGLPLDLIEEFIQDFILQAKEFQPKIYASLDEGDIDNVKILAHKLKGVAANLRVEDAHEVLSSVSATTDAGVIRENIDAFYIIIQRLAKEEETPAPTALPEEEKAAETSVEDDDRLDITFDDDEVFEISNEEVPQQIDMPELADDDFYQQDILLKEDEPATVSADENFEILQLQEDEPKEEQTTQLSYSKKAVAAEIGLSIEDFNELFADFEKESLAILADMKKALEIEDFATIRDEALKLKGMSDNMRLQSFTDELTKIIHSTDKDAIAKSIDSLQKQLIQISAVGA